MSSLPLASSLKLGDSDNELLSRRFTTSDPENEPLILDRIPEEATGLFIDLSYELSEKAQLVRCRHCCPNATAGNHRRGYVVRTSTGEGFLVGHRCGARHYPDRWGLISGRYARDKERRNVLVRVGEVLDSWPALQAELRAVVRSPAWDIHDVARDKLREQLPELETFLLMRLERYGGDLSIVETYRDVIAEAQRPAGTAGGPIFRERIRQVGSISGREFLVGTVSLRATVNQDGDSLCAAINELSRDHGALGTRELRQALHRIDRICARLGNAMTRARSLQAFSDQDHLKRLCLCATDWCKQRRKPDRYLADATGISWVVDGTVRAKWGVSLRSLPNTPRLDARHANGSGRA